jgi:catechol 2,3-dioxygenase-like lactoylglutathione lyase family enzyme
MKSLGLRHLALNVADPQRSKDFYTRILKMELEWEPDADNVYLTTGGQDNLALHRATQPVAKNSALDHLGIALPTIEEVDVWYEWIKKNGVPVLREVKTHRDGARSFYIADPDGNVIQMIYHPPIAKKALSGLNQLR